MMHDLKEEFTKIFDQSKNLGEGTLKLADWLLKATPFLPKTVKTIKNWFGEFELFYPKSLHFFGPSLGQLGSKHRPPDAYFPAPAIARACDRENIQQALLKLMQSPLDALLN